MRRILKRTVLPALLRSGSRTTEAYVEIQVMGPSLSPRPTDTVQSIAPVISIVWDPEGMCEEDLLPGDDLQINAALLRSAVTEPVEGT